MKRVLYVTNLPAPYKIDFLNLLGKDTILTVLYERRGALDRNSRWFSGQCNAYKEVFLKGIPYGPDSSFAPEIVRYINRKDYDVVILNGYNSLTEIVAIIHMKLHRIKFGICCDGMLPSSASKWKSIIKHFLISSASFWLSSGTVTSDVLLQFGAKKNKIWWYPFSSILEKDIDKTKPDKDGYKKLIGCTKEKMILFVGQFIERKGIDILINAFGMLDKSARERFELRLVGNDTNNLGLAQCEGVKIDGFKTKKELEDYYRAADLFILPTREDIWGLVINEALSFGLPVITTQSCGAGLEMISNGVNGFIVPSDDPDSIADRIEQVLKLECFDACIATAKKYSIEEMERYILKCIEGQLN